MILRSPAAFLRVWWCGENFFVPTPLGQIQSRACFNKVLDMLDCRGNTFIMNNPDIIQYGLCPHGSRT